MELAGLAHLWSLDDVQLLNSAYAIEEGTWSWIDPRLLPRFKRLLGSVATVEAPQGYKLRENVRLDPKDQPILVAAIHGKADYLLTGDARHFGHLYGKRIEGVRVLRPAQHLERRRRR